MLRRTLLRASALVAATLVVPLVLVGCSSSEQDREDARNAQFRHWAATVQRVVEDRPNGQGAAGSLGSAGAVTLTPDAGHWDVLAVCNGIDHMYFRVSDGDASHVHSRTDVACGATARIPLDLATAQDVRFRGHPYDEDAKAVSDDTAFLFWYFAIVPRGWEPPTAAG
ncbi:hypothetical protein [Curtobacterium sp. MMLR14_010]|uniref:hypothetical protein n=1 Tax=Curtobacterium sp. MMLR14_010 TaxID=1898743 RepID=UPI001113FC82|nr:hypothetical protein [Curtobacterium sp. MMLR14_010]